MIVLKILLILLLVIAGLLLLLLFFPFSYSIHGQSKESWHLFLDVNWLFYLVFFRARVDLEGKKPRVVLRILGIPITIYPRKKKEEEQVASGEPEDRSISDEALEQNGVTDSSMTPDGGQDPFKGSEAEGDSSKDQVQGASRFEKIKVFFRRLPKRVRGMIDRVERIREELLDSRNKEAVKHLLSEIKGILSHYKPRRMRTDLTYSAGDPALTGEVLGALSVIPLIYQDKNRVVPDFMAEEAYLKGSFRINGHVILFFALAAFVRLIMDRNVRRMIKHLKTMKG